MTTRTEPLDSPGRAPRIPVWLLGVGPLVLVAGLVLALVVFGGPGLERNGVPVEAVAVERTVLRPGEIEVHLRNDGPDAVTLAQVIVNDAYIPGAGPLPREIGKLESAVISIPYDWIEGEAYEVAVVTSTGGVVAAPVEVAAETPSGDASFYGLLALIGIYVGVIPVTVGMLWLPFARRVGRGSLRFLLALTVGLLVFLAADALVEAIELGGQGAQAFGGPGLALLGAVVAFVLLSGVDAWMRNRREGAVGYRLALLVAIGIGLHNLGEGLAIGSAYAIGELALGAFLVVGFALHNTTEGLAIVAPIAKEDPPLRRLVLLGLVAGAPAILGAWIGGVAFSAPLSAFLLGFGVGAIAQVCVQLAPGLRDDGEERRAITPLTATGLLAGLAVMYLTGLLIG